MDPGQWKSLHATQIADEYAGADFGDARLTNRCVKAAKLLAAAPSASLPLMAASDTELAGIYRFMNNARVNPDAILEPHRQATIARAALHDEVLVLHDTSEIAFTGDRVGTGDLSGPNDGFFAHPALVLTRDETHTPLGVVACDLSVRRPKSERGPRKTYEYGPDNEHTRWETNAASAHRSLAAVTDPIHVLDREGDAYLLLSRMTKDERRFVIRSNCDREVDADEGKDAIRLSKALSDLPVIARREVVVSKRKKKAAPDAAKKHPPREGRSASLDISARRVILHRPRSAPKELPATIAVNVVLVVETNPPEECEPIEWRLLTTEPIDTEEQVLAIVDIYRARWRIEEFFNALKSGCKVEKRDFVDARALKNVFAMLLPVAWQMLLLRTLARAAPDLPATQALSQVQLDVLIPACARLPPSQRPPPCPNVRQALLAVAALGGHLKRNGEPGWLTIARGFLRLREFTYGFLLGQRSRRRARGDV